jgi:benzaldehyde dehydrogenase (NAD)
MMNAKAPEFLSDTKWVGRVFSSGWLSVSDAADVTEPATGRVLGRIGIASPAEMSNAAAKARSAQPAWYATAFDERARILRTAAQIAESNFDGIVGWIVRESGSVPAKAAFELQLSIKALMEASALPSQPQGLLLPGPAERLSVARRVPVGVVGIIAPFNFPMYLAVRALAPALALGNAVVLKPDPRTAVCGGIAIARIFEEAGLPADALHVLPGGGAAGARLCEDPNVAMVQFTGSTAAGRKVGELAGRHLKKVSLELGGKNALIVLDDAELDLAVSNTAWSAYLHSGQICMSAGKILVQRNIAAPFIERLAQKALELPVADPASAQVALGPMINRVQLEHTHGIVQKSVAQGARIEAGGTYEGLYYKPTVLSGVAPGMAAYEEEIFGPVAPVIVFDHEDEAIELANQTDYGLSAGVLGSMHRAMQVGSRLRTGLLHINDQTVADEVVNPFGGFGASGNGTSIGGPANWEEFTQWQWLTIAGKARAYPF